MTWNYRIIKRLCLETKEVYYALNEVFYQENGTLMAFSDRDDIVGGSPEEIVEVLEMMLKDANKDQSILTEDDFSVPKKKTNVAEKRTNK